ncbi:unnamed protein product, partial [Mesorhabditis belari]|uniref:Uncharacterized protein n=1 Tax=Mesorhabditis belari TaxID=2138241 RepID=A0AAF3FML3_9BILA
MNVNTEDFTFPWGQSANPLEQQTGQWRLAIYEDVQESIDGGKLYCLYEPETEREAEVDCKGYDKCLSVFDMRLRCFMHPIYMPQANGRAKFLFSLKCPSPQGGTALILVTEAKTYEGRTTLHFWRLDLDQQGTAIVTCRPLSDINMGSGSEYICSMREDSPECIVLYNPGLNVCSVNCMAEYPTAPQSFNVYGAELTHFYDGFLNAGLVYLVSAAPDGHLDYSRVHVLNLQTRQINTHQCRQDPGRGFPPSRKQAALNSVPGYILLAGGEVEANGDVHRLVDYWVLNCENFEWTQVPAQMPCPLIEPRLTTCNSGNVYLWGDYDVPLPGMPNEGTHLRILKITGMENYKTPPPSYDQSAQHPVAPPTYQTPSPQVPPPYPSYQPMSDQQQPSYQPMGNQQQAPSYGFQQNPGGYPPSNPQPNYPTQNYDDANYPRQDYGGQSSGGYSPAPNNQPGQQAYYPPQKQKKDKDCSLM